MCGVVGFIGTGGGQRCHIVSRMLDSIGHRGSDDRGTWLDRHVALGHVRLSVIARSARGHQPFVTADGTGVLSCHGEMYNFAELRRELESSGVELVSRTDTEVVLQALHHWGPQAAVPRFDGMFALAYYDRRTGEVWLARDRLGIKPLFVARRRGQLVFASEPKALFAHPAVPCEPNVHALRNLVLFERFEGTMTRYAGVEGLPPGTLLKANNGTAETCT